MNGKFLYRFGKKGNGDGKFNVPRCLSVNRAEHRVQVFEPSEKFMTKFEGSRVREFMDAVSKVVLSNGRKVVTNFKNHRIQIFE